jgi:hypothetical protein
MDENDLAFEIPADSCDIEFNTIMLESVPGFPVFQLR